MGWNKKYSHMKPYKKVRCIDAGDCKLLNYGIRGVINETETNYLVQFNTGAANWYSKSRFVDLIEGPIVRKEIEVSEDIQQTLNRLF